MTKYDVIYEELQEKVNAGELTLETAEYLNDVAYKMYADTVVEAVVPNDVLKAVRSIDNDRENILKKGQQKVRMTDHQGRKISPDDALEARRIKKRRLWD